MSDTFVKLLDMCLSGLDEEGHANCALNEAMRIKPARQHFIIDQRGRASARPPHVSDGRLSCPCG